MILNPAELRLIAPLLRLLDSNESLAVRVELTTLADRWVAIDAIAAGITIRARYSDSPPSVEHYAKPLGLALAYRLKGLEELLYPERFGVS